MRTKNELVLLALKYNWNLEFFKKSTCVNVGEKVAVVGQNPSFMCTANYETLDTNIELCYDFIERVEASKVEMSRHEIEQDGDKCKCGAKTFVCQDCGYVFCTDVKHLPFTNIGDDAKVCYHCNVKFHEEHSY